MVLTGIKKGPLGHLNTARCCHYNNLSRSDAVIRSMSSKEKQEKKEKTEQVNEDMNNSRKGSEIKKTVCPTGSK